MTILDNAYVPTLAVRASELNGLQFLPGDTKNRMSPCFLLAPWANSNSLDRALERIHSAFPDRQYFMDIDRDYHFTNLESAPQMELAELLDPANSYKNWIEFVKRNKWVQPCVQMHGQSESDMRWQIEQFRELGRTFCMRIERARFPSNMDEVVAAFATGGAADFAIVLEGGWAREPLSLAAWFVGELAGNLDGIGANVPLIISSTSMPKEFSHISGVKHVPMGSRRLFDQVSRNTNRAHLIYGDWGSTRPRERPGIAARPLPRIDYPTSDVWCIARNKDEDWTYRDAAIEIVNQTDLWAGDLGVWGEDMIRDTSVSDKIGINTPQKNVAARVNIHLHLNAWHGEPNIRGMELEEDWTD